MFARSTPRDAAALALAALVAACSSGSTSIPAPAPVASTTLLARLGADTIAVERYTHTATHMEGVLVTRMPATRVARYSVELGPNAAPRRADFSLRDGDGATVPGGLQSLSVRFGRDSVVFIGHRSAGDTSRGFAVRGPILPYTNNSYGLYELAFARMSTVGRDSMVFAVVPLDLAVRQATPLGMRVVSRDSVRIDYFGNPLYVRHDRGSVIAVDGSRTTFKVRVERVGRIDLDAIAKAWAQREQSGAPAGQPSTRDTVEATVGSAHVWIDYGRPALRGRNVWVDGVLGDTLWRTGANAATQLRTDVALVIGGATVPAGTYTLWTATSPRGYRLVVNKQAGQWGTVYDARRDLVRVPLRESSVAAPADRFTIDVEPQGATAALLNLTWGMKRLSVPLGAK
jgi:hypothetical protein